MKRKERIIYFIAIALSMILLPSIGVRAAEVYEPGDIDRIYINCDTNINNLTKDDYMTSQITVVHKDGTIDFSDDAAQVKLRGNSTSKAEKKPLKIKLSSGKSVLGMDKGKKWNILANAFDKTLIRNRLSFDLGEKLGLSYLCQNRFIDLYYNDVLMGSYLITEPVETGTGRVEIDDEGKDFMIEIERERYESDVTYVNTKSGIRFAINAPEEPTASQIDNINNYLKLVEDAFKTNRMSEYSKYIDVDSFVNYYIVSEIFKAVDFNYSSTRFYVKDGKMYAGPIWDVDLSSGNASPEFYKDYYKDGVSYKDLFCTQMKWYGYLIKSDEFVAKVNARLQQMYPVIENMYKTNSLGINQIDALINDYRASFERNYAPVSEGGAGWSITKRYSTCDNPKGLEYTLHADTYMGNVDMLRNWLANRVNYLRAYWKTISNNEVEFLTAEKKTYNSIILSWYNAGVADGNVIYYKAAGGKYKLLKTITDPNKQEYTVKKLKPGIKYYFKVCSYMTSGTSKVYSKSGIVGKKLKLSAPKAKVKRIKKKAVVTWKKIKGADGYIVYSKSGKGKFKKTATLKGNRKVKYIKKNCKSGKKYKFKVRAYVKYKGKIYISN